MKYLYPFALLFGLSGLTNAQNYEVFIDTTFVVPGGSGFIRFYQRESSGKHGFSGIIKDFDSAQRTIASKVSSYQEERNRYLKEEAMRMEQELQNQRIAMFTNIIGLTPSESQVFWPLYNEYLAKRDKILNRRREINERICNPYVRVPANDSKELTSEYIKSFQKETDLMAEYYNKFKAVLDAEKLLLLYRAEYQFKVMMLRSL